ncbi:hypothetical protein V2G26_006423 [Clonostachys chloroleuca]
MAEAVSVAAKQLPKFKLGKKQVFLPNHVITFLRKDHLPPNEACFHVPLTFTKFDLRDYLWNLYNVEVTKVRSYVKELPLTQKPGTRMWYRPRAQKIMTVQLAKPFQWPEVPTNTEAWSKEMFDLREEKYEENNKAQTEKQKMQLPMKSRQPITHERKELSKLAKQMLSGNVKWSNDVILDPKWDSILEQATQHKQTKEESKETEPQEQKKP